MMVCSVIMVAYALERFWAFMKVGSLDTHLAERIKQCVRQGQIKEAVALCGKNQGFITHASEAALAMPLTSPARKWKASWRCSNT